MAANSAGSRQEASNFMLPAHSKADFACRKFRLTFLWWEGLHYGLQICFFHLPPTMNRLLKTLLLWLLIAALPLQGMAAVVKASCGQRHHTTVMAADGSGHAHEVGKAHHGHGDMHGTAFTADNELPNTGTDSPSDPAKPTHTACSACAACCVGAAAPPSAIALTSASGEVSTAIASPALSFTGFIPSGLERPPKSLSA